MATDNLRVTLLYVYADDIVRSFEHAVRNEEQISGKSGRIINSQSRESGYKTNDKSLKTDVKLEKGKKTGSVKKSSLEKKKKPRRRKDRDEKNGDDEIPDDDNEGNDPFISSSSSSTNSILEKISVDYDTDFSLDNISMYSNLMKMEFRSRKKGVREMTKHRHEKCKKYIIDQEKTKYKKAKIRNNLKREERAQKRRERDMGKNEIGVDAPVNVPSEIVLPDKSCKRKNNVPLVLGHTRFLSVLRDSWARIDFETLPNKEREKKHALNAISDIRTVKERLQSQFYFECFHTLPSLSILFLYCVVHGCIYRAFSEIVFENFTDASRAFVVVLFFTGLLTLRLTGVCYNWLPYNAFILTRYSIHNKVELGDSDAKTIKWFGSRKWLRTTLELIAFYVCFYSVDSMLAEMLLPQFCDLKDSIKVNLPSAQFDNLPTYVKAVLEPEFKEDAVPDKFETLRVLIEDEDEEEWEDDDDSTNELNDTLGIEKEDYEVHVGRNNECIEESKMDCIEFSGEDENGVSSVRTCDLDDDDDEDCDSCEDDYEEIMNASKNLLFLSDRENDDYAYLYESTSRTSYYALMGNTGATIVGFQCSIKYYSVVLLLCIPILYKFDLWFLIM